MVNPVATPETQAAAADAAPKAAPAKSLTGGKSFAAVLDRASSVAGPPKARDNVKPGSYGQVDAPEGERWRPVRGDDDYAHIVSGPRKGMLINLSHGARRGEVFRVETRNGERVHVYGEGKDEKVIPAAKDSGRVNRHDRGDAELRAARRRPHNETWAPVPGHSGCVDILSGPRNGYYLNVSGNERDGQVFQMVFKHGREYHVYGKGKDREVILVRHPHGNPLRPHGGNGLARAAGRTGGASPS